MKSKIIVKVLIALGITILLFLLYFYKLDSIPLRIHGDEGETALAAIEIMKNPTHLIGVGWYDLPLISFLPHSLGMFIFGKNIIGDRIGSVIFGVATIPIFYLFLKLLFDKKTALTGTALLAFSHIWIALSRLGITYVQATFFLVLTLYFLFLGIKTKNKIYFISTGISMGLGMYAYYAVGILPFLILPPLIAYFLKKDNLRNKLLNFFLLISFAIIIFLPQGLFFLNNPESFSSRTRMIYIFSQTGKQWTNYNTGDFGTIIEQTKRTFSIFAGDNSTQYGYKGQLFDYLTIFLFLTGLLYVFKFRTEIKSFLLAWLIISIMGQVLTTIPSPIFLPRLVVGLPVIFIFCALGIDFLSKGLNKKISLITTAAIIFIITIINLKIYFFDYPKQLSDGLSDGKYGIVPTKIAYFINSLSKDYEFYFLTSPYFYSGHGTLRFLSLETKKIDINSIQDFSPVTYFQNLNNKKAVFILLPDYDNKLKEFGSIYPRGEILRFYDNYGKLLFISYKT